MSLWKPAKSRFWHFDYQFKGGRHHGSTGCTARRDAERFEAEHRRRVSLGETVKPALTIEQAADLWFANVGEHLASHATCLYQLGNLAQGLGRTAMLHDLDLRRIDEYVARRRAKVSNASVNREVTLLRRVVRWAQDRGYEVPSIAWRKALLPEKAERIRELAQDEEHRLFAALPESLRPLVEFALLSGQRRSEIIALRWADVDLAIARATLWVKGGKPHTIPLSPRMVAIIANQPKVCPQVFTYEALRDAPRRKDSPARIKGQRYPFSKQGWMRQWRRALESAGIEDYRFHDNRHTTATRNLRATGNLKAVQKLLGHADVRTTTRYAHALEDDVRAMLFATESRIIPEPQTNGAKKQRKNKDVA